MLEQIQFERFVKMDMDMFLEYMKNFFFLSPQEIFAINAILALADD